MKYYFHYYKMHFIPPLFKKILIYSLEVSLFKDVGASLFPSWKNCLNPTSEQIESYGAKIESTHDPIIA